MGGTRGVEVHNVRDSVGPIGPGKLGSGAAQYLFSLEGVEDLFEMVND